MLRLGQDLPDDPRFDSGPGSARMMLETVKQTDGRFYLIVRGHGRIRSIGRRNRVRPLYPGSGRCYVELDETIKTLWLANGAVTAPAFHQVSFPARPHRFAWMTSRLPATPTLPSKRAMQSAFATRACLRSRPPGRAIPRARVVFCEAWPKARSSDPDAAAGLTPPVFF